MLLIHLSSFLILLTLSNIQCDITNLDEFFSIFKQNTSVNYSVGCVSRANFDVIKRYLPGNIKTVFTSDKDDLLKAVDNETIIGIKLEFV